MSVANKFLKTFNKEKHGVMDVLFWCEAVQHDFSYSSIKYHSVACAILVVYLFLFQNLI